MHIVLIIVVVIVALPVLYVLNPAGRGRWTIHGRANEWARRRNAEGNGNFMTKPIWGKHAHPPEHMRDDEPQ